MSEVIQFPCPACGATLRLPFAMAGVHGPCPVCGQEIIAPDPANEVPARTPAPEPPPQPEAREEAPPTEVVEPVAAIPPAPPVPDPAPCRVAPPSPPATRGIPLFPVFLISVLSLAAGIFIGAKAFCGGSTPAPEPTSAHPVPPPEPADSETTEAEPPAAAPADPAPKPEPAPEPAKVSATAEATLKAFLDAPDWAARAAYVLSPETVRPAMESYSHTVPDGPTPYQSVSVQNSYTDRETGNTLFIFKVVTAAHPTGIPVAVAETDSGWLVDWQAFVEFRDDLFESFAEGPVETSGRFHLLVSTPPPPRAANTENEHFSSFLLEPPFPDSQRLAYVKKSSEIHPVLTEATANGAVFTPVLEVAKRKTPDGKSYLEITGIIAHDWLPEGR